MKATLLALAFSALAVLGPGTAVAASDSKEAIDKEVKAALNTLYEKDPGAKALAAKATGILVFPTVRRAGLVVGGQHGDGALLKKGKIVDYYTTSAISLGLEAGVLEVHQLVGGAVEGDLLVVTLAASQPVTEPRTNTSSPTSKMKCRPPSASSRRFLTTISTTGRNRNPRPH